MTALVIDKAQVLARDAHGDFAHALRAALDIRVEVVFAGSSETRLRKMFASPTAPFYNWAPLEPFPLLAEDLHAGKTLDRLTAHTGKPATKSTVSHALRRLQHANVITRLALGEYQFEDEAFAEFVRRQPSGSIGRVLKRSGSADR